jgi:hypothetical protein
MKRAVTAVLAALTLLLAACGTPDLESQRIEYTAADFLRAAGVSLDDVEVEVGKPKSVTEGGKYGGTELVYPAKFSLNGKQLTMLLEAPRQIVGDRNVKRHQVVIDREVDLVNFSDNGDAENRERYQARLSWYKHKPLDMVLRHLDHVVYAGELPLPSS